MNLVLKDPKSCHHQTRAICIIMRDWTPKLQT